MNRHLSAYCPLLKKETFSSYHVTPWFSAVIKMPSCIFINNDGLENHILFPQKLFINE